MPNGSSAYNVDKLVEHGQDSLWLATSEGVFILNTKTDKISALLYTNKKDNPMLKWCTGIAFDGNSNAWVSTEVGLVKYNIATKQQQLYNQANSLLPTNVIDEVYADKHNNIWIGMSSFGLGCLPFGKFNFTFFNSSRNKEYAQANCRTIAVNDSNEVLFNLRGKGLFVLQHPFTKQEKIININSSNGLPSDFVLGILIDAKKRTWVHTAAGISLLNKNFKSEFNLAQKDGLLESNFETNPYQDAYGNYFVGGENGFQTFNVDSILQPKLVPQQIHFSAFTVNAISIIDSTFTALILPPTKNNIGFQFAAIATNNGNNIKYAYKLNGFDKDWITTETNRVNYNNLPSGKYQLQIKTGTTNGGWNTSFYTLPITIQKQWYIQTWFIILCSLITLAGIGLLYRYRIATIQEKLALKTAYDKKIAEVEMKALRAQMNPHFIFNCLNSINRYIVKSDEKTASNYLTKFSKLIRLILDNSAAEFILLDKEIETLRLYIDMEILRFDNAFDYTITIDENLQNSIIQIPTMLIQPYIENAIWHGLLHKEKERGVLKINFLQKNENCIVVTIKDNGVGRQKAQELKSKNALKNKSYGMQITNDRIQLLNNFNSTLTKVNIIDLVDENQKPTGTQIEIEIPIK